LAKIITPGWVVSKVMFGKESDAEAQKFRDYFEWTEPLKQIPSHRLLAGNAAEWLRHPDLA
jgi:transcriptional accessory protein Tex/SPT6